ncbi:MAG TPA: S1 RNA-binding domain-containing protein [Bacillota bacterium]|mgnify:CR=1 FL=1|jgi:S1 RNA binding domain protein|nr:S1 RNA-binding domain-containing protein [Bacillota bacterium]HOL09069.1 S1 RNA-binding domain-containing protein [Bacillota bacterium]HPO96744.1 S1 RNA-binding domain-containing protein [Bacillota bacterium]
MALEVGQIVEGKVAGITNFGAFIELSSGETGLVHISEVADKYVKDVKDFIKQGDLVKVKVLTLDNGKIGLSIRQAQPNAERNTNNNNSFNNSRSKQASFEDKLSKFLKDSDERQSALRKNVESKRGGRGGGRVTTI